MSDYLWTGTEWSFPLLDKAYKAIEDIALNELGLDVYPNDIEIITSEQMVDAYSSVGMPINYHHWSFGKSFTQNWTSYQKGHQGLAYEIVINSNPCISYLMEENTMTMQALVMAHACVSGDTEYLTPTGWKRIDQYDGGMVGQFHEDGRVTFVEPQRYIVRDQKDFIHVKSEKIDQAITDDHTVVAVNGNGNIIKITGAELAHRQADKTRDFSGKFITGFLLNHETSLPLTDEEIALHIAIKADGNIINPDVNKAHWNAKPHFRIRFHLKKERKLDRLRNILQRMEIPFEESPTYEGRMSIHFNYPSLIDKRFGPEWYQASPRQLRLIGEEVCHWDGSLASANPSFSSQHKQDADFVQFAWAATGFHAHLRYDVRAWSVTKSEKIGVSLSKHGRDGRQETQPFERIASVDGKAYCFTVETNMLIIRRDSKISVTGNCMGHNHFFRHNHLFKEWTDASSIVDYLVFAKNYIAQCEEREGREAVEKVLDSCHALMNYGVNPYKKPSRLSAKREAERIKARLAYKETRVNELFDTLVKEHDKDDSKSRNFPREPESNILYFCEKYAPDAPEWKREIIRIVRKISQYYYPQGQTKMTNEGCATYSHYRIMNRLHEKGLMTDGNYLEFLHSHTSVVAQPSFNSRHYSGINPYALGFALMRDIERICKEPTDEDRRWFPAFAGSGDEMAVLRDAWANYRDESFIRQFLSPKLIRDFGFFRLTDAKTEDNYLVTAIHNESGYEQVREALANNYERHSFVPQIEVMRMDPKSRTLSLRYTAYRGRTLDKTSVMINHVRALWGETVYLYDADDRLIG